MTSLVQARSHRSCSGSSYQYSYDRPEVANVSAIPCASLSRSSRKSSSGQTNVFRSWSAFAPATTNLSDASGSRVRFAIQGPASSTCHSVPVGSKTTGIPSSGRLVEASRKIRLTTTPLPSAWQVANPLPCAPHAAFRRPSDNGNAVSMRNVLSTQMPESRRIGRKQCTTTAVPNAVFTHSVVTLKRRVPAGTSGVFDCKSSL